MPLTGSGDLGRASCLQDVAIQVYLCQKPKAHNPWTCSAIFDASMSLDKLRSASVSDLIQVPEGNIERPTGVYFIETNCGKRLKSDSVKEQPVESFILIVGPATKW
jgi:hypothetical protein